jgi:glutathione S-transferase
MQLYHFPSPNPQKVTLALKELGLDCELIPVDLAKGEQRQAALLAKNPFGRVPVLVDAELDQAISAYLGEKTGRLWPATAAGRAEALRWLFFLSQHIMALPASLTVIEEHLAHNKWMMGTEFGLVDLAYCPVLNVIDKSGFSLSKWPKTLEYLDACRARPAWTQTPRLPRCLSSVSAPCGWR